MLRWLAQGQIKLAYIPEVLANSSSLHRLISKIEPDEICNPGAQSHVGVSFEVPEPIRSTTLPGS